MVEHDSIRSLLKPSEETKKIIDAGYKKAEKFGLRQVNQEVILLGLLSKKMFQKLLKEDFGVKARELEGELASVIRNSDNGKRNLHETDSETAIVILEAHREAEAAGLEFVGPFQLFEGLIAKGTGVVHKILEEASITKDKLPKIRELAKSMNQSFRQ